ncbi:carbohydrate sulfotransferase 4-like [Leguminivora glycinivorella]|uniref:carbohydrate sulfotransferase 4-like n=1 Tax=Leguminivora glycinivorella TaxID=1035111 RepID=UPI00200E45BA|nr:carbohydrate sulfotransferase 4-like [Leguminivora glycinivorella]
MVLRFNFYWICFAFSISVLLILAVTRCNTNHQSNPEKPSNLKNLVAMDDEEQWNIPHDGLPNIDEILEETRANIALELSNYNFTNSAAKNLQELLIESGGQPLRSLIISTWRSGSTFLGDILNAMNGNFYHFEPFMNIKAYQIRGPPEAEQAISKVKALFKCDFDTFLHGYLERYLRKQVTPWYQFKHNDRLWRHVKYDRDLFFDPSFFSSFCKLFPFQSMKLVRLRLRLVQDVLDDHDLNVKVVLLVRDPRAVMQSRQGTGVEFCKNTSPDCSQPELLCADMISDYIAAKKLQQQYPNRLMVLRMEDLSLEPKRTTLRLFKFLGLALTPEVEQFLETHTTLQAGGAYATFRVSRDVPFKWKNILHYDYVEEIQTACKQAMDLWGYRLADNATHMASKEFYPLETFNHSTILRS